MGVGFNHTTQRDLLPLVWRENAPHVGSPVRAHYPEAVRVLGCQLLDSQLGGRFSSANQCSRVCGDHSFNLFDEWEKFVPNCHFNRKVEQFLKEKHTLVLHDEYVLIK